MKICSMMEKHGITNPNSQKAVSLCLSCELGKCELEAGDRRQLPGGIIYIRMQQARQLYYEGGLTVEEAAKELGVSERTVIRYIR